MEIKPQKVGDLTEPIKKGLRSSLDIIMTHSFAYQVLYKKVESFTFDTIENALSGLIYTAIIISPLMMLYERSAKQEKINKYTNKIYKELQTDPSLQYKIDKELYDIDYLPKFLTKAKLEGFCEDYFNYEL